MYITKPLLLFVYCLAFDIVSAKRILVLSHIPSYSHRLVFRPIIEKLARIGHELVVLTDYPANYKDPWLMAYITEINVYDEVSQNELYQNIFSTDISNALFTAFVDRLLKHIQAPEMRQILFNSQNKFDLVIVDASSAVDVVIGELLNIPCISLVTSVGTTNTWRIAGNPTHPVLHADTNILYDHDDIGIFQRIENVFRYLFFAFRHEYSARKHQEILTQALGREIHSIRSPGNYIDMTFVNMFPFLTGNRPVTPSTILLGGLHLQPRKPLPTDLQEYMDNSKRGIIYISFGTLVLAKNLSEFKKKLLLELFAELPYDIMWKFEDNSLENVPSNVFIRNFYPQFDVLGHPNIKLFITHGGLQSMEESIFSGVPLLTVPNFWDQHRNAMLVVKHEIGETANLEDSTKDSLKSTITRVIANEKYKENIKKLSKMLTDRPMTSLEQAIWWIEYVLRHGGAKHLRPKVVNLPLYQYYMLDIFFIVFACIAIVSFMLIYYCKSLLNIFKSKWSKKVQDKKDE